MAEIKDKKDKKDKMDKRRYIFRFVLIISIFSIIFMACSRAYEPSNYQKKGKDCDCSRWK